MGNRLTEYGANLALIPIDNKKPYKDRLSDIIRQDAEQKVWPQPKVKKNEQN